MSVVTLVNCFQVSARPRAGILFALANGRQVFLESIHGLPPSRLSATDESSARKCGEEEVAPTKPESPSGDDTPWFQAAAHPGARGDAQCCDC
jgi:hypothetical protein